MNKGKGVYNVVVIGAGTAGLVTAAGTAGLGGRVALIERNLMGGDCLNFGCVPSKALISSARLIQQIRESEKWGLDPQEPQFVFEKIFARMRARRAKIAPNDSQERFESLGVDVFHGQARFVSPHEIEICFTLTSILSLAGRGGRVGVCDGQRLRAKNFVIATGSRAAIPKIDGIESVPYFTNETIFDELREKPGSMIVLGGGPIGCELGQAFARLGVKITIVQRAAQLLLRKTPMLRNSCRGISKRKESTCGIALTTRVSMLDSLITLEGNYKPALATAVSPVQFTADALLLELAVPNLRALILKRRASITMNMA